MAANFVAFAAGGLVAFGFGRAAHQNRENDMKSVPSLWEKLKAPAPAPEPTNGLVASNISYSTLMAYSDVIGRECAVQNRAFLLCKNADRDPYSCEKLGEDVHVCVRALYVIAHYACPRCSAAPEL
jgi:hypothetical protein